MDFQAYIRKITEGEQLSRDEMTAAMRAIMTGSATPSQMGGFLVALRLSLIHISSPRD